LECREKLEGTSGKKTFMFFTSELGKGFIISDEEEVSMGRKGQACWCTALHCTALHCTGGQVTGVISVKDVPRKKKKKRSAARQGSLRFTKQFQNFPKCHTYIHDILLEIFLKILA
jgi:hypothetical protein